MLMAFLVSVTLIVAGLVLRRMNHVLERAQQRQITLLCQEHERMQEDLDHLLEPREKAGRLRLEGSRVDD